MCERKEVLHHAHGRAAGPSDAPLPGGGAGGPGGYAHRRRLHQGRDGQAPAGGLLYPAEPGHLRDHLHHVQLLQGHRRGHRGGGDAEKRHLRPGDHPELPGPAHGGHPHQRQRHGVRGHHPGQGPAAGTGQGRRGHPGHGPGGHRRGTGHPGGGGAEDLRHPPGPQRPGPDAGGPGPQAGAGPAQRPGLRGGGPAGPTQRLFRRGPEDPRPEPLGPGAPGRPPRHGQELLRPEHGPERGQAEQEDGGGVLPGDEQGAAGHPPAVLGGAGGAGAAADGAAEPLGLGKGDPGRPDPAADGHPHRRQPHAHRGGHERQVPPHRGSGAGGYRLPAADELLRRQKLRRGEPPAGGQRHLPDAEDYGQGAGRAGAMSQPAQPGQREAGGQAPHALGPA